MTVEGLEDFNSFIKYGYFVVKNAFSKETAQLCRDIMWDHIKVTDGVDRYDQSTWPSKVLTDKVWIQGDGVPWENVFTDRYSSANKNC